MILSVVDTKADTAVAAGHKLEIHPVICMWRESSVTEVWCVNIYTYTDSSSTVVLYK